MKVKTSGLILWILPNKFKGISLAPFGIFIRVEYLISNTYYHEAIHYKQQKEMLYIFFYLWYILEWIIRGFDYHNISFEREARFSANQYYYLRPSFGWIKFLKLKENEKI